MIHDAGSKWGKTLPSWWINILARLGCEFVNVTTCFLLHPKTNEDNIGIWLMMMMVVVANEECQMKKIKKSFRSLFAGRTKFFNWKKKIFPDILFKGQISISVAITSVDQPWRRLWPQFGGQQCCWWTNLFIYFFWKIYSNKFIGKTNEAKTLIWPWF